MECRTSLLVLVNLLLCILLTACVLQINAQNGHRLVILPNGDITNQPAKLAFVLTCRGNGNQPSLFTDLKWFDPRGEEITNVYTRDKNPDISVQEILGGHLLLQFRKPRPDDSGLYKCKGFIQSSEPLEAQIQVQFFDDVTWEDCPEIQILIKGETQETIRCRASANPKPQIQWMKDHETLDSRSDRYIINSDGIRINGNVEDKDGGRYHVRALVTETGRLHDRYITVQVYVRPEIISLPSYYKGIENEQASLKCEATGSPEPIYTWLDPNKRNLSTVGGYLVDRNTGALTIPKVNRLDRGEFTCIAENGAGKVEKKTLFHVIVRPTINSFQNVSYDQGFESKIECRAHAEPRPTITIRKDGMNRPYMQGDARVAFENRMENEESILVLSIFNTQRSDDGLYYCRAENEGGHAERVGHLQVRFKPDLSATPTDVVKTWDNHPANLTCIAESIPNATINWWYRGQLLNQGYLQDYYTIDDTTAGVSRLYVKPGAATGAFNRDIYGAYKCIAENPLGKDEKIIKLEQAFRPAGVTLVAHERITPTTITFSLGGPTNDGGLPLKLIHVQYRERDNVQQLVEKHWPYTGSLQAASHGPYVIDNLRPFTEYIFRFAAQNDVGIGDYSADKILRTERESRPDRPKFHNIVKDPNFSDIVSQYANQFHTTWIIPPDNGRRIEYFEIKYYEVLKIEDGYKQLTEPKMTTVSMNEERPNEYTFRNLKPNTYYKVELRANNELGFSEPEIIVFKTAETGIYEENVGREGLASLSLGIIIAIVIVAIIILLIIMDITFFIKYKVGALYFLRTHVCAANPVSSNHKKTAVEAKSSHKSGAIDTTTDGHSGNGKTEVDNPAFDNPINMANDEHSPMIFKGSNGGKGDGVLRMNAKDSVV